MGLQCGIEKGKWKPTLGGPTTTMGLCRHTEETLVCLLATDRQLNSSQTPIFCGRSIHPTRHAALESVPLVTPASGPQRSGGKVARCRAWGDEPNGLTQSLERRRPFGASAFLGSRHERNALISKRFPFQPQGRRGAVSERNPRPLSGSPAHSAKWTSTRLRRPSSTKRYAFR